MTANVIRWLLLLAVILAILGAIQCPRSSHGGRSFLRGLGSSIRSLGRNRSSNSARSSRRGAGDGESSSRRQPNPGDNSGGRLPRSRSSSPPNVWGVGAGSSSSSSGPESLRMYGRLKVERVTSRCRHINGLGDAHVITNMQVSQLADIIQKMKQVEENDECRKGTGKGFNQDSVNCQDTYAEFKKIPAQFRGDCSDAISANCMTWHGRLPQDPQTKERKCSFFIQTGMRSETVYEGYFLSLTDCLNGIKNDLFMDRQLSSLGINPPEYPPQPLLPASYSPDH